MTPERPTERDILSTIVVLEDGDEDFSVLRRILADIRPDFILDRVRDGDELSARISRDPEGLLARLALFDVNVPGVSGIDCLAAWRRHDLLSAVPVVVLSGSARADEVDACYRSGAAGYLAKPFGLSGYRRMLDALAGFWLDSTMPSPIIGTLTDDGSGDEQARAERSGGEGSPGAGETGGGGT